MRRMSGPFRTSSRPTWRRAGASPITRTGEWSRCRWGRLRGRPAAVGTALARYAGNRRLLMSVSQTQHLRPRHGLHAPPDVQLDEDVFDVRLDRPGSDGRIAGDLLVSSTPAFSRPALDEKILRDRRFGEGLTFFLSRETVEDQFEYVAFASAQCPGSRRTR
jgi:hypothetical protein